MYVCTFPNLLKIHSCISSIKIIKVFFFSLSEAAFNFSYSISYFLILFSPPNHFLLKASLIFKGLLTRIIFSDYSIHNQVPNIKRSAIKKHFLGLFCSYLRFQFTQSSIKTSSAKFFVSCCCYYPVQLM